MVWIIGFVCFCLYAVSFKYYPPVKSDAIVVLTGGKNRINTGIRLMDEKKATALLISGVNQNVSQKDVLKNIPDDTKRKITLGYKAKDTNGNAKEISEWINKKNIHTIILVTSFYHMPRSVAEIIKQTPNINIVPHPVFPKSFNKSIDWIRTRYAWLLFLEYHKFIFVQLKYLF